MQTSGTEKASLKKTLITLINLQVQVQIVLQLKIFENWPIPTDAISLF